MDVLVPAGVAEAHDWLRRVPGARLLAGGTDLMVEFRGRDERPPAVVSVGRLPELRLWRRHDAAMDVGAAVTLTELAAGELSDTFPALGAAARAVGCPQIRNAATLGGNLATAAPTSDLVPVLEALDATATVVGSDGERQPRIRSGGLALGPADIVVSVRVPMRPLRQTYLRVGARRGMALPLACVALVADPGDRTVRCAVGGSGRAAEAERWVADHVDWTAGRIPDPRTYEGFGRLVAAILSPVDDRRAPAAYRRRAVEVLARRALMELL